MMTTTWKPFPQYGSYFRLFNGTLEACAMNRDGTMDEESAYEVDWYGIGEEDRDACYLVQTYLEGLR